MQKTLEIPREQWGPFLADFLASHREEEVRVEVASGEFGDQEMSTRSSLMGLAMEAKGSDVGAVDISVALKDEADTLLDHRILHPEHIYLLEGTDDGMDCLSIEDRGKRKTLIFVRGASA